MKITLKGVEHDATKALPLVWGDYRKLKKEHGVTQASLRAADDDALFAFALVVAQKLDPTVTVADLEALPLNDGYAFIRFAANAGEGVVDHPTSGTSTSAP